MNKCLLKAVIIISVHISILKRSKITLFMVLSNVIGFLFCQPGYVGKKWFEIYQGFCTEDWKTWMIYVYSYKVSDIWHFFAECWCFCFLVNWKVSLYFRSGLKWSSWIKSGLGYAFRCWLEMVRSGFNFKRSHVFKTTSYN